VQFDADAFAGRLEEAVQREAEARALGQTRWSEPAPSVTTAATAAATTTAEPAARLGAEALRLQLLGLLRAFCDAARPAGGLPLDATGAPRDLDALVAAGRQRARDGEGTPKALDKIRSGRPVDLRIAVALLHAMRFALGQPRLQLADLGGLESERLRVARRVERALHLATHELPASVGAALQRRAAESAGYTYLMDDVHVHYGGLREEVDVLGLRRLRLVRTTRYVPLRLAGFSGRLAPVKTYEWYQWNHVGEVRLTVQAPGGADHDDDRDAGAAAGADAASSPSSPPSSPPTRSTSSFELPLVRRLHHERSVFTVEIDPRVEPALLERLVLPAAGTPGPLLTVQWREELFFNIADRDILVWYSPVGSLEVEFEPALAARLEIALGDSPGLQRSELGWRLDRSLMPREVVAVRLRLRGLDPDLPRRLGPSGECPAVREEGPVLI
jgi:hypothetical protein